MEKKKYLLPFICGITLLGGMSIGVYCHLALHSSREAHDFEKVMYYGRYMKHISMDYEKIVFGSMIDNIFENKGYNVHNYLKLTIYNEAIVSKTNNTILYRSIDNYLQSYNALIPQEKRVNSLYASIEEINGYEYLFNKKKMVALCREQILNIYFKNFEKNLYQEELAKYIDAYQEQKKYDDYDNEYFYTKLVKKLGKMNDNITLVIESIEDEQVYFVEAFKTIVMDIYSNIPDKLRKTKIIQDDYERAKVCIDLFSSED